ncbi:MAG: peptide-methionine (S)-S-oxide reductase MsrA [Campylobacterota bacterium]|nr:peptide-methionine (S)-S-oxide reductase MsrA [Campylobacterota bacterium]
MKKLWATFVLLMGYFWYTVGTSANNIETTTVGDTNATEVVSSNIETIYFAAGCFWGVEKHFEHLDGVADVSSGYVGGNYNNPTYDDVLKYRKLPLNSKIINHTEAVKVTFDNTKASSKELIESFWELHDPTQLNRQGNDIGNNYRSAIFWTTVNQKEVAYETKKRYQELLSEKGYGEIVTQIAQLETFYTAEAYHQDYLKNNPNGYCPNHSTGVQFEKDTEKKEFIHPLGNKEIVVIKSKSYCPYCEKFEKEVSSQYRGSITLRTVTADTLKGFEIKTDLSGTPTILFIDNTKEVFAHRGFMDAKQFYKTLGDFKLGKNSKSYRVAFNESTDSRFCKQYKIFKDTPDGVFVDKLSGDILFDTRERFNSGTGWLSFYKAADNATIEKEDNSFGMQRIEVIAKKSGIHLGHVFPRADGTRRFCINATVLEFVPRDKP